MSRAILFLLLSSLGSMPLAAEGLRGVMLTYMVTEPGVAPYPSRIIVTDGMVRMDDGEPDGDYLLFDRQRQLISSVTHEDETVLEIPLRRVSGEPPLALERERIFQADSQAPKVGGKQPHRLQLRVNGRDCYQAVVVPGLLPGAVQALRDFHRVLAGEQGKMLSELPVEMVEACDLALHTFYPEWMFESGLALQEYDASLGRARELVSMDDAFEVDVALFSLPPGYRHYKTP